ncbi:ATP-binding protein [Streptomyces sp. NPDC048723]|uniref:ATP-binding protein n=1 Tax=Streptomyces sp. NPDC048723 TaxID=3365589 RepID=UPI0037240FC0
MSIAAPLLNADLLSLAGVPNPLPLLGGAEVNFNRTGLREADMRRPEQARRISTACLGVWGLRELVDDTALLLSELVTNAFVHGDGEVVRVRLYLTDQYVCLEVCDGSREAPQPQPVGHLDENGRGLAIVDALADAWGVAKDGASIWCTVLRNVDHPEGAR